MEKIINQNNNMTTEAAMEESMRENTTEIEEVTTAEESVLTVKASTEADESTTLAEAATTTEEPTLPTEPTDIVDEPTSPVESDTPMQDSGFMKRLEIINISDNKTEMEKKLGVKASYVIEKNTSGEASKFYIQITSLRIQNLSKRYSAKEYMRPKKIMEEFLGYGHPLDKDTLIALIRHMIDNINDYVNGSFHPTLGWTTHNGSDMLLLDRAISNDPSYQSVYEGPLKDKIGPGPETDAGRYREELRRLYNDKPKMQLIYSVGLTGIIRQLLRVSDTSFMLSVCGEKGAGKTTSERGALSAWGNPEDLLSSFNASGVAIDDRYRERLIIPNIIDEGLGKGNDKSNKVKDYIRSLIFGSASGKTREISKRGAAI